MNNTDDRPLDPRETEIVIRFPKALASLLQMHAACNHMDRSELLNWLFVEWLIPKYVPEGTPRDAAEAIMEKLLSDTTARLAADQSAPPPTA